MSYSKVNNGKMNKIVAFISNPVFLNVAFVLFAALVGIKLFS